MGIATLAYNFKTSDADELRTLVYQPLYADLVKVQNSITAIDIQQLPPDKALIMKVVLTDRVRDPKQLRDLLSQ